MQNSHIIWALVFLVLVIAVTNCTIDGTSQKKAFLQECMKTKASYDCRGMWDGYPIRSSYEIIPPSKAE